MMKERRTSFSIKTLFVTLHSLSDGFLKNKREVLKEALGVLPGASTVELTCGEKRHIVREGSKLGLSRF